MAIIGSLILFGLYTPVFASDFDSTSAQTFASRKISHFEYSGGSVSEALSAAAIKFDLPIGSELNGQLPSQSVSIEISGGSVADVISAIIAHAPGYKWIEKNGVVDIMPRDNTNSILDLNISHFKVHHAPPNSVRLAVTSLPEVQTWLSQNHVVERSAISIIGGYGRGDTPQLNLERRNVTLREIMNSLIVKKGGPLSWSFSRYGRSNQYLTISIE